MKITIYTTTTCPYCKMLMKFLDEKGVAYEEKLVDQDDAYQKELIGLSGGFLGVPFLVFQKGDKEKQTVVGFDRAKIESILS